LLMLADDATPSSTGTPGVAVTHNFRGRVPQRTVGGEADRRPASAGS
jgi:hypothetical protein